MVGDNKADTVGHSKGEPVGHSKGKGDAVGDSKGDAVGNRVWLPMLQVYMFALTAMMLFGNKLNPSPRRNFDNIGDPMLTHCAPLSLCSSRCSLTVSLNVLLLSL